MAFKIPIAFCIFNRPDPTRRVFEAIAHRKPSRLLLIADGARDDRESDDELVQRTREIVSQIDWPCEVTHNYSDVNLGCRKRMVSGISWAFEQCEELIILEDDCLPDDSFFDYCQTLLARYRDNPEVMMISGDNFQPAARTNCSYYFSRYTHIWGWASWRRAWHHYDVEMTAWPAVRATNKLANDFADPNEYRFWQEIFDQQHAGLIDTWDFAWEFACMNRKGLTILPETNLVSNLGFGIDATHTIDALSLLSNLPVRRIYDLIHPAQIRRNDAADHWTFENIFCPEKAAPAPVRKRWYQKMAESLIRKSA